MLAKWGVHFEVQESRASQLLHQIGLVIVGPSQPPSLNWVESGVRFSKVEFAFLRHATRMSSRKLSCVANDQAGRSTGICFFGVSKPMQLQHDRIRT